MTEYKEYAPYPEESDKFPKKGNILYGRPIDHKRIKKGDDTGQKTVLSLADPHYMLVIFAFPQTGVVMTVSSTSMKSYIDYPDARTLDNVIIVNSDYKNNGLDRTTIFEFHPRTINLLKYTNEFFENKDPTKTSPIMGKFNEGYEIKLTELHMKCPQVQTIGSYLVNNRKQILPKNLHEDTNYSLPLVTIDYKKK